MNLLYVSPEGFAPDGQPCPTSVKEAFRQSAGRFSGQPVTIRVMPGVYEEKLVLEQPFVTLEGMGSSPEETVIRWTDGAYEILADGKTRGTFRTATFRTDTHDFTARNLTFENACGPGKKAGQGLALYADGDRQFFDRCRLIGWQDTPFTAPLPEKEYSPGGFRGPKEFAPRINGRQYYRGCFIQGEVDFIFGSATAYFEDCEFYSRDIGQEINGFVAAASTPEGQKYGYVMDHCRFTGNCPPHSVYLGRPWRPYARTVLLHCEIGPHITEQGWDDWMPGVGHDHLYYAEYACTGPGAAPEHRPAWACRLTDEEAAEYTKDRVLDGWNPFKEES